jgi:hypothetical protein
MIQTQVHEAQQEAAANKSTSRMQTIKLQQECWKQFHQYASHPSMKELANSALYCLMREKYCIEFLTSQWYRTAEIYERAISNILPALKMWHVVLLSLINQENLNIQTTCKQANLDYQRLLQASMEQRKRVAATIATITNKQVNLIVQTVEVIQEPVSHVS